MSGARFAIGIDLGGTTIKAGAVDATGAITRSVTVDSKAQVNPDAVINQLTSAVEHLLAAGGGDQCTGIGIGSPGVVVGGIVKYPPNFKSWTDVDVAAAIRRHFSLPVDVENDANVAAIGESKFGAGKAFPDFLFVIWGTGVGGGIIIDKKIFRGPQGGAGEIGHVTIDLNGPQCNCGNRGCVESYIGQRYLSERTRTMIRDSRSPAPASKILELAGGDYAKIEPAIIARAAEEGDATARKILTEAGTLLGVSLASILNVLDLRVVIVGGGISASPAFVFDAITASIRERVLKPHQPGIRVLRAELGNTAGIIGAASLVM